MLEKMDFPEPVISVAIEPKTKADQEKMGLALQRLAEEDPVVPRRAPTRRPARPSSPAWASCTSKSSSTACCASSRSRPTSASRRSPTARRSAPSVEQEGKFVRQTGGRGQYGHVWLKIEPREEGKGYEFVNGIVGGTDPARVHPGRRQGIQEALNGVIAGYPVVDVKVTIFDGSFHEVDSNEIAFKIAGSWRSRKAAQGEARAARADHEGRGRHAGNIKATSWAT